MEFETIAALIAEQFNVDRENISEDTDILEDLNATSMDAVDLIVAIESATDIEIPDEAVDEIRTVGDIVAYVKAHSENEEEE
ncbi:MAG: acyl carrier protein [Ruminococcus sp.]|nr:acyl carrier protein [Ruminococcus sp.]MBQ7004650.1 acyl carrier protein [Oscillospiraceae bacterium]